MKSATAGLLMSCSLSYWLLSKDPATLNRKGAVTVIRLGKGGGQVQLQASNDSLTCSDRRLCMAQKR